MKKIFHMLIIVVSLLLTNISYSGFIPDRTPPSEWKVANGSIMTLDTLSGNLVVVYPSNVQPRIVFNYVTTCFDELSDKTILAIVTGGYSKITNGKIENLSESKEIKLKFTCGVDSTTKLIPYDDNSVDSLIDIFKKHERILIYEKGNSSIPPLYSFYTTGFSEEYQNIINGY